MLLMVALNVIAVCAALSWNRAGSDDAGRAPAAEPSG